ncbi:lytic transglycosylase domain-containing protein [Microbacterium sp. B2969]|uniref:Lytic transglycosylase domain-containing protein n=1 Tax=Microbacterium alkaliflavum TaxID=3248839 RepID=A0ABW7QD64_9MICO
MTDPTPEPRDSFSAMIQAPTAAETRAGASRPTFWRRWALPVATIILAVLGVGALAAAALTPPPADQATTVTTPTPTPIPTPSRTPIGVQPTPAATVPGSLAAVDRPVSELADPAWVARIGKAGSIPERALAAYAGAALAVTETHPGCGIGWNTLAAIGFVESEHGSMNGATLRPAGTVTPAIIGIPLDGNGANAVPDTDQGRLDGDSAWDRAVGPMQFIPSTWELTAQDGNRDGKTDVNQIDDAALAAAMHLCDVGGDLTVSANWIAAIGAYNASVEYNNRVAEAANHYATLR